MDMREIQFFRQKNRFLESDRDLSKFLYGIFRYLISITRLLKKVRKT